jgi:hypothetical protein
MASAAAARATGARAEEENMANGANIDILDRGPKSRGWEYAKVGLAALAYYWMAEESLKPIKGRSHLISPAIERSFNPAFKFVAGLFAYKTLRGLSVKESTAAGAVFAGIFGVEWYIRAYESKLVPVSLPPQGAASSTMTGWEPWSRFGTPAGVEHGGFEHRLNHREHEQPETRERERRERERREREHDFRAGWW